MTGKIKSKTKKTKINAASPLLQNMMNNAGLDGSYVEKQKWEKLDELYRDIGMAIITIGEQVNVAVNKIKEVGIQNTAELITSVDGIRRDLEAFTSKLIMVKDKHNDKSGEVSDEDYSLCIDCFNDYVLINDEFRALIFPPLLTITESLMESTKNKKAEDATNVNVVTDIEVKEPV